MDSRINAFKRLVLAILAVSILLMSALCILVGLRGTTISARKALAPKDLDRLAEILAARKPLGPHVSAQTEHDSGAGSSEGFQAGPPRDVLQPTLTEREADEDSREDARAQLPTRLERAASPGDLTVRWLQRRRSPRPTTATRILISKAVVSTLWAVGAEEEVLILTCKTGRDLMELGKWEEARRQFREVLHEALDNTRTYGGYYVRFAAHCLAWLETDPERATEFLELSCRGRQANWNLAHAIDLAEATGSDALADHYRDRLYAEHPLTARAYERSRERRVEQSDRSDWHWREILFILPDL